MRYAVIFLAILLSILGVNGQMRRVVVADSISHAVLAGASLFDHQGNVIGISDNKGRLPYISSGSYPVTVRYLGFQEKVVERYDNDTVFLQEVATELPEVLIESQHHKVLHILAYMREYSTLSTYTDTVFLFREKMVDYMLTPDRKVKYKGWRNPRILKSKSYYHFTNAQGLDSVSDKCNHHFSWSDWIGIVQSPQLPATIKNIEYGSDTLRGKYSVTEVWKRNNDRVIIDVNVLADTTSRKWVPNLSVFFKKHIDFENFRLQINYGNVVGDSIAMTDLAGYSFNIESNGRGHDMFKFNHKDEPFYVSTYAEVYILDKEYITVKEAKKWAGRKFDTSELDMIVPAESPELQLSVRKLMARVDAINHNDVRLDFVPDRRLMSSRRVHKQNIGQRALSLLKSLTGITSYKSRRNLNKKWDSFKQNQIKKNKSATRNEE